MSDLKHYRVIILGSGPAGLTAAIYTGRASLSPALISGPLPGGQLTTTTEVENFPGFPEGIMGPDLMQLFEKQARRFGAAFLTERISSINLDRRPFTLKADKGDFSCDALIIATGANPRYLGLPEERSLLGFGVSTCATCDGAFFRDKVILVVGGGDSACEEASFLTRFGREVYMVHRRDELRASKIMQERVKKNPRIKFFWDSAISRIHGDKSSGVTAVTLKNLKDGSLKDFACDAVFVAIGHVPNSELFKGKLELDENGYIITTPGSSATSIPGVFACGDVQDHFYRQAITAAGSGCMAAIEAERWLEKQE